MEYEEFVKFVNVSRETFLRLSRYVELLEEWGGAINLVSRGENLWHRHIIDSAQLIEFIESDPQKTIVDMGSGGGLPGVVLAIICPNPITLIESDRRKSLFLKHCAQELRLPHMMVINDRVEKVVRKADYVTARALAPLKDLLGYAQNFSTLNTTCLFPKGQNYDKECEEALKYWSFELSSVASLSGDGRLLTIRKIKKMGEANDANTVHRESKGGSR